MAEAKILEMRTMPSPVEGRQGKQDRLVFYQVDGKTVFLTRLPEETYSEKAVEEQIRKEVKERGLLVGKTFTV